MGCRMPAMVLVLGVVLAGGQGSAFAAVAALGPTFATSTFNSANKTVTVNCPSGKQVLGTGHAIGFSSGEIGVVDLIPNAALTGASVRAVEDGNGFAGNWDLTASAICATPVPGLERVVATSPVNSANKGVSAACPAGKRLLGTGASIAGGSGQVVLRELIPNSALTGVSAFGAEDESGFAGNWSVTAYAVCASPVGGLQRVVGAGATESTGEKSAFADCPAGKRPTGGGAKLTGSAGQVVIDHLFPQSRAIWAFGNEDENGFAGNWSVTAYAICVNSSVRQVAESANDSFPLKNVKATCPTDMGLTGVGGDISGGVGEVLLPVLIPDQTSPPHHTSVSGSEDQTGTARNWFVRAYAICSTPLPALERIVASSTLDSSDFKQIVATCSAGKKVVGAGGLVNGAHHEVVMDRIVPNAALTSVAVRAQEDEDFTSENWQLTAYALCANPPPGLQLTSVSSGSDSEEIKSVTASCPSGKTLLGTGGELIGGLGEVVLDDLRPDALLTNVTVTGIEDGTGFTGNWSATAYAICANT